MNEHLSAATVLQSSNKLVLKVGSSLLADERGALRADWLASLAADLAALAEAGVSAMVVSSGAVALGRRCIGAAGELTLEQKQAAAAIGQIELAQGWREVLAARGLTAAQILLTPEDTEHRRRHLNARATLSALLAAGAVPVINENDTVATDELRYGDNDRLAARVAQMAGADLLILLTDVDGLYDADPTSEPGAEHIASVRQIDAMLLSVAGDSATDVGTGGMRTKLEAARIAMHAGCHVLIADGRRERPLRAILDGARTSLFHASGTPLAARKQWISGSLRRAGSLVLDDGAVDALRSGRSLLPVGVTAVVGEFGRGDTVALVRGHAGGEEVGVGLAALSSTDARRVCGRRSADVLKALGLSRRAEIVHRNDLVMHRSASEAT
jgi:glutamate 5-kinase